MTIDKAKEKLGDAVYALGLARIGAGSGPGSRELAQAAPLLEQAEKLLQEAERARRKDSVGGTSEMPPSGTASMNEGG